MLEGADVCQVPASGAERRQKVHGIGEGKRVAVIATGTEKYVLLATTVQP
jgi:hypothetical protein